LKKWAELIWLRLGINGRLLWTRQWTFGVYNVLGVSWLAEELLAPKEGLCCTDFLRGTNCIETIVTNNLESWQALFPTLSPLTNTMCLRMDFNPLDETHLNAMGQLRTQFLNSLSLRSCMFLFTLPLSSAGHNSSPWQHKLLHYLHLGPTTVPLVCRLLAEAIFICSSPLCPSPYVYNFNCCLSVHVDNYTIIVPTKCTSFY
jgi:hypothetical protein